MIDTVNYDIVGSYNDQRFPSIDSQRTINLFEYIDSDSKKPKTLIPTSGLRLTSPIFNPPGISGGSRAQFVFGAYQYQVFGANVYRIDAFGNVNHLNSTPLSTTVGYVGIDANTFQIMLVDGVRGYIYDTNTGLFEQITDPNFPPRPIDVTYLDGFFVVPQGLTNNFFLSSFNQGLVWGNGATTFTVPGAPTTQITVTGGLLNYQIGTPVQFSVSGGGVLPVNLEASKTYYVVNHPIPTTISVALTPNGIPITLDSNGTPTLEITNNGELQQGSITSHPGTIVGCRTLHRKLFLFSENFIEPWENQGIGSNLPFRRINSALIEVGTPAIGSIQVGFDRMFFLSQDKDGLGPVMQVDGISAMPVSERALDDQLAEYASTPGIGVSDARGILIRENGILFYRLNFTNANHTFVYNITMSDPQNNRWHEEEVLNGDRHPAQTHSYFNGNNYYGHYSLPILYIVDDDVYTNNGELIRRTRIGAPVSPAGYQRLRIDRFQLDVIQGNVAAINQDTELLDLLAEDGVILALEDELELLLEQGPLVGGTTTPTIWLSYSKDGGQTFAGPLQASMGEVGQRTFRTCWRKLGVIPRGQSFVPKIEFFNNYPFVILGAAWAFEVLPE